MPSIYDIKPAFQALLRPLVARLAAAGVTANQVTVAAAVLSGAAGGALAWQPQARWPLLLLPAVLFARMALNAIDGMLAREHNMKSPLGGILNELADVVSDAAIYLPFALVPRLSAALVIAVVLLAVISEMAGVVAVQIGASRRYDGPLGKSDRAFLFGVLGLVGGLGVAFGRWTNFVLAVAALLLVVTILNRSRKALAEIATSS